MKTMANTKDPKNGESQEEAGPRDFAVVLGKIADGECLQQLSEDLHRLAKSIGSQARAQAKAVKGALTLKINIIGDTKGVVSLGYDIDVREPKPRREASTFWINKHGNLVDQNPRQIELGLRDVSKGKQQPRDVGGDGAPAREV